MAAGHGVRIRDGRPRTGPRPNGDAGRGRCASPAEPRDHQHDAQGRLARCLVGAPRRWPTGRAGGDGRGQECERGTGRQRPRASGNTSRSTRGRPLPDGSERSHRRVARRRKSAAAGQLADQPAEASASGSQPTSGRRIDSRTAADGPGRSGTGGARAGDGRAPGRVDGPSGRGRGARRAGSAAAGAAARALAPVGPARRPTTARRGWVARSARARALGRSAGRLGLSARSACPRVAALVRRRRGPCLVLRSVLARVGILLWVDRPVGAAGGAVPARPAPVWLELARVRPVV